MIRKFSFVVEAVAIGLSGGQHADVPGLVIRGGGVVEVVVIRPDYGGAQRDFEFIGVEGKTGDDYGVAVPPAPSSGWAQPARKMAHATKHSRSSSRCITLTNRMSVLVLSAND
jgi:hypothetical protein